MPVFKLDAGSQETFMAVNRPARGLYLDGIVDALTELDGIWLQTVLVDGDPCNVARPDLEAYFEQVARIRPKLAQIYSIDRPVPHRSVVRVEPDRLARIADQGRRRTGVEFEAFAA
jgi:wyosine [tRNA(Phe)-imidazoG37] synthetase (radical SAM superfamily)